MSDLLTDLDLKTERATEPPRKWRNWWQAPHAGVSISSKTGRVIEVEEGDIFSSDDTYPTKDVAESVAFERQKRHPPHYKPLIYVGAFPEGERPE